MTRLTTMAYAAPMMAALKFLVQFLLGDVRTAWESRLAQESPIKNVKTRTTRMYAKPESVDLPRDDIHVSEQLACRPLPKVGGKGFVA